MTSKVEKTVHYNDWPNAQGFDVQFEERSPVELQVEGTIPAYAAGTLFRTGLGARDVETDIGKTFRVSHWFDSLSQVHRFQIHPPEIPGGTARVTYNSRSCCDGLIANIKKTGQRDGVTFGAKYDPCMSIFQKVSSMFKPRRPLMKPNELNMSVTMSVNYPGLSSAGLKTAEIYEKGTIQTLATKTDNDLFQMLDPESLEPIGVASQGLLHPLLKGPSSATHAEFDPRTGDVYNYNLEFLKGQGIYRIFHVSASTAKTSILATVVTDPAYVHSLFITEHFVVLCIWNSVYACGGAAIMWNKNIADSLAPYDSTRRCKWYVVDKVPVEEGGRGHIATYDSDPFFCFHTVNAYEEVDDDGNINIVADLIAYSDLDIIKRLYLDNLQSDSPNASQYATAQNCRGELRRFTLPLIPTANDKTPLANHAISVFKAITGFIATKDLTPELPTFDPRKVCRKYRYVYGVANTGKSTLYDAIIKYDLETHSATTWSRHGHTAGEPIFVPVPEADADDEDENEDEDAGVLLSVVLDGLAGKSYLLVLDAKTLTELGKAHVDGIIGFGFHGTHVPQSNLAGVERGVIDF